MNGIINGIATRIISENQIDNMKTPCIHFGNSWNLGKWYVLLTLKSGLSINVLWEFNTGPPVQKWWNKSDKEWTTMEELLRPFGKEDL